MKRSRASPEVNLQDVDKIMEDYVRKEQYDVV